MTFLAHQIRNLVLQMQNNPASQINIPAINLPAQNHELNLVPYPDFSGGEQDSITWLEDIKKAFEANQVQNNQKILIVIPQLKGMRTTWWVTARTIRPAIDCLRPKLSTTVASFMPNTLSAAYECAKAFENSFKPNTFFYNPYLMASPQEVLVKFTKTLNAVMKKLQESCHYACNCTNPLPQNNLGAVVMGNNATPLRQNNDFFEPSFDKSEPLFLPADKSERPTHFTRLKRRHIKDSNLQDLMEEERINDQEDVLDNEQEPKRKVASVSKLKKETKTVPVKKRKVVPSLHSDLVKSLCKTKVLKKRICTFVNLQSTPKSTALYCDTMVQDKVITLIINSGSSGSVVSSHLLIPVNVVVIDAPSYQAIIGNDWLSKVNANIDYNTSEMIAKIQQDDDNESDDSGSEDETESDLITSWYNVHPEGLGAGDACWNIDGEDNYKLSGTDIPPDFDDDESEPQHEFFFDQIKEPPQ
ncbi:14418_t:CDS:2, partial [Ambispora leptoticha]